MERRFVTTENDRPSKFSPTVFFFSSLCLKVADFCPSCTRRTCGMANVARCPPPPSPKARSDKQNVRSSQTLHCEMFYLLAERILQLCKHAVCPLDPIISEAYPQRASQLCALARVSHILARLSPVVRCPKLMSERARAAAVWGQNNSEANARAGARAEGTADLPLGLSAERASGRNAASSSMLSSASARSSSSGRAGAAMAPRRKGGED
jgi:hypothetical protein